MARGELRIYLGAAPGVGKTYAMLGEGRRRAARGTDVIVAAVETNGRKLTEEQLTGLEIVPTLPGDGDGDGVNVDAVLARQPQVALVDDLARQNSAAAAHRYRWQDVEQLLDAGIDVISAVDIDELESMRDVCEVISGHRRIGTVPDRLVRGAEQVELIDATPEALRRRLAHGNIYPPDRVDAATLDYFRPGNLGALRQLALLWLADKVDESLDAYRRAHDINEHWETRERVVVALTGAPDGEELVRRAARIAARSRALLAGLHVRQPSRRADDPQAEALAENRRLLLALGGTYQEVASGNVARALVHFARAEQATQLVLGATRRSRLSELFQGSVVNEVVRRSGPVDVHVISGHRARRHAVRPRGVSRTRNPEELSSRRRLTGWLLAVLGPALVTAVLAQFHQTIGLPSALLSFVLVVVLVAAVGGFRPAALAALVGFLAANWFFTPPYHQLAIADAVHVLDLLIFVAVAGVTGFFVSAAARRSAEAARARAASETLAALAARVGDDDPLPVLVQRLMAGFGADAAALLVRDREGWRQEAAAGAGAPTTPDHGDLSIPVGPDAVVALVGRNLDDTDLDMLLACATQLTLALERRRLRADAAVAEQLNQVNELRAGLLAAVSHDLRTPLSSIRTAASTLRLLEGEQCRDEREELLTAVEEESDRLSDLVANLVGMSRVHAGAVQLSITDIGLDEVVARALSGLPSGRGQVCLEIDEGLPRVRADVGLLERAVANLLDNALKWSPPGQSVRVTAASAGNRLVLQVADRGPGIPVRDRERVFQPFQRLGDTARVAGLGLGLAVARGFVELMDGELVVEDTPGGGTTMVLSLQQAS